MNWKFSSEVVMSYECCTMTEILYGNLITLGLVSANAADKHPGFTADSIGYNVESGQ